MTKTAFDRMVGAVLEFANALGQGPEMEAAKIPEKIFWQLAARSFALSEKLAAFEEKLPARQRERIAALPREEREIELMRIAPPRLQLQGIKLLDSMVKNTIKYQDVDKAHYVALWPQTHLDAEIVETLAAHKLMALADVATAAAAEAGIDLAPKKPPQPPSAPHTPGPA
jgi:hypothetical protein